MNNYITFLKSKGRLDNKNSQKAFHLNTERLQEQIVVVHADALPFTVSDAMSLRKIASPETLHRKINELMTTGWIKIIFERINKRK